MNNKILITTVAKEQNKKGKTTQKRTLSGILSCFYFFKFFSYVERVKLGNSSIYGVRDLNCWKK